MARNIATVTFTVDAEYNRFPIGSDEIVAGLTQAAARQSGNARDITVVSLEPVQEVNVPAADYEAFQAWRRNTGRA